MNMPSAAGGTAASKKRKIGEGEAKAVKYYAVRAGKTPGVYTSWEDCKANTYGFKGAVCRSLSALSVPFIGVSMHWR